MPRFFLWDGLRKAFCRRACGDLEAEPQATRKALAEALADNARLLDERRDTALQIREKNRFLGSLSHELRAPLNAIIGFSEVLASSPLTPDSGKRHEFARHIHTSGRHLLRLINDVLELSTVDAEGREFVPEQVDLRELIARVADLLHTPLLRRRLQLTVDVKAEVAAVVVDRVGLKQALLRLLTHAADMAPEGTVLTVRARLQSPEGCRIEVQLAPSFEGRGKQALGSPSVNLMLARRWAEARGGAAGQFIDAGLGTTLYLVLNLFQPVDPLRRQKSRSSVSPPEP
ncbi:sensor histidine kinase KdpD [Piscinibacter sp. HJYY11]|uniref:sensor histidine kinase n=1 Tax=Piscinibacter sp. HJYY11 TaxID=2801333 RepID=UPI00191DED0E|nr:HAMP domain-containing sensor histidine kinase [Piscinibacter sp. HJYY11]MBL0730591.1 HAMP domain-containing histidine kinase [Piscinibacter sp. HJYY11]